ncbi:MAG: acyltransferase, partial [Acidimicrobiales bacterium]
MNDRSTKVPTGGPHEQRLRALDGIRAFAVTAVILFHAGITAVSGGLLGVDVFFVLSGFLITSLLCTEHGRSGSIRLGRFWAARARRLLPGLFVLLIGIAVFAWIFRQTLDLSSIRGDAIATLLYVANWHFILSGQSYFEQALAPSPLLHMWSLAVEEQYYLVWPLVAVFVLSKKGPRGLALVASIGAALSALLMAVMFLEGFSTDRLYYGTDTRAQALLVGSALGALASQREWRVIPQGWAENRTGRVSGTLMWVTGAAALIWFWHDLNGQNPFLYEGGFLLVALASGAVITNVTSWRSSVLSKFLSLGSITYIGRISYGLYLYHWPLFLAIDHAHTGMSGATLLAVRLAATLAAAVVSFHLIEQPIRRGAFAKTWRGLGIAGATAAATCVVIVVATIPPAFANVEVAREPTHITDTERRLLAEHHAFTTNPIRFLLVGDSVALTAGEGLRVESQQRYGVRIFDWGIAGCDLTTDATVVY